MQLSSRKHLCLGLSLEKDWLICFDPLTRRFLDLLSARGLDIPSYKLFAMSHLQDHS